MKNFLSLFKKAGNLWYKTDADHMAATVSYYGLFAITPLLFLSVVVSSMLYGKVFVVSTLDAWGSVLGPDLLLLLHSAVQNLEELSIGFGVPIVGALFFLSMVVVMFNTFSTGLNQFQGLSQRSFKNWFKKTVRSIVFISVFELYLLCLVLFDFGMQSLLGDTFVGAYFLKSVVFLTASTILFTLMYHILPDKAPSKKACFFGAVVASGLFWMTRMLVTFYIATTPIPGLYGAAGLILVLLIWLYASSAVIYFGAAFAYVFEASVNTHARS